VREVALLWGLSDVAASDAGGEGNEGVVGAVLGADCDEYADDNTEEDEDDEEE